jgi:hypothetical protein
MYIFTPDQPLANATPPSPRFLLVFCYISALCLPALEVGILFTIVQAAIITPDLPPETIKDRIFRQSPSWTWFQRVRETARGFGPKASTFNASNSAVGCAKSASKLAAQALGVVSPMVYKMLMSTYGVITA